MPDNLLRQVILWLLTIQLNEPLSYHSLLDERFPNLYDFLSLFFTLVNISSFQLPSKTKLFCIHIVILYLDIFEFCKKLCIFNRKKKKSCILNTDFICISRIFSNIFYDLKTI